MRISTNAAATIPPATRVRDCHEVAVLGCHKLSGEGSEGKVPAPGVFFGDGNDCYRRESAKEEA